MPRIALIPSTIAFGDRGVEVAQPILQSAMQLADTFTTELPKIRMRKEAMAEDKRRYEDAQRFRQSEVDYRKSRDDEGDFVRSFGDLNTLMSPDTVDYDGDGQGDLSVGKGGAVPRLSMSKGASAKAAPAEELPSERAARVFATQDAAYGKARQEAVAKLTTKGATGRMVQPSDEAIESYLAKQGVTRPEAPQAVDTSDDPFGQPANYGLGADPDADGDSSAADPDGDEARARGAPVGVPRMVMSDMRRLQALQRLDSLRAADPSGERRRRHGLPDDRQIEQLKMQLMGDKYPGMRDAQPSLLPSEAKQAAELAAGLAADDAAHADDGMSADLAAAGDGQAEAAPAAPAALAPAPIRMAPPTDPVPSAVSGNDNAMHDWNVATGGNVDPRVAEQVRADVEHGATILANHPDPVIRARGAEVQQALRKAVAMGNMALVAKLRNAIGRLGVFQPTAPAPVAPPEEVPTMAPDLQRAIIARMGTTE